MASLQDQLLQAGIVDKNKAKKIKQEKRKEAKSSKKGHTQVNETKEQAKQKHDAKVERDKELNQQRQAQAEAKAIQAQIIQMIKMNRVDRQGGEIAYQFPDGTKIKKIYVTAKLQDDLIRGRLAIAKLEEGYEVLPAVAAEKIMQRDEKVIVLLNTQQQEETDEDDPYADYQVPDDLMW